ncbi:hypothetical protein [Providencia manganoxydans]
MNNTDQNEHEPLIILSDHVVYDPLKRTLSRGKKSLIFQKTSLAY